MKTPQEKPAATPLDPGTRDPRGGAPPAPRAPAWLLFLAGWLFAATSLGAGARHERPARPPRPETIELQRSGARELRRLPGIGPVRAARIVELRWERAGEEFELSEVEGIGPRTEARVLEALGRR